MKINIVPRIFFEKIKGTIQEQDIIENCNIISIITPKYSPDNFEEEDPPFSQKYWNNDNICIVKFHDCDHIRPDVILMNEYDAKKIKTFMEYIDQTKSLYIHCTAGISRSQAVGYVLNLIFNKLNYSNIDDYEQFEQINKHKRRMNCHVKNMLLKAYNLI